MRLGWCLLVALVGCDDAPGAAGDDDDTIGGDGDADGDADAPPRCEEDRRHSFSVHAQGAPLDGPAAPLAMALVASASDETRFEEDPSCDPTDEVLMFVGYDRLAADAWIPPIGSSVRVTLGEQWEFEYFSARSPDGVLLWEGGDPYGDPADPPRFRVVDEPQADACADRLVPCAWRAPIQVAVTTDDGEIVLDEAEERVVNVEGEPFLAVVETAERVQYQPGCGEDMSGGARASAYLVRTTPVDLPAVEPAPAPLDDCPAGEPAEWDPCTTRPELQCDYEWGGGCTDGLVCEGCFWRMRIQGQPEGVDCGIDPNDCMTNGDDGACSEEAVCTDCSCPEPIGQRHRCVWPGDGCPPCE